MGNSANDTAAVSFLFNSNDFDADTSAQKRALSYASTIYLLFSTVMEDKFPADKVLANYFREHKKHGSKDRKIIRETLFGVFRWWGWLNKANHSKKSETWLGMLATVFSLEAHPWRDISQAWEGFADLQLPQLPYEKPISLQLAREIAGPLLVELELDFSDLSPQWFWPLISNEDSLKLASVLLHRPPIWARIQGISRDKGLVELQKLGIVATPSKTFSDAISLGNQSINLNNLPLYKNGQLEIQDLASQVIGQICEPKDNQIWWDACCGAGGKTLQLSSLMHQNGFNNSKIISSDIRYKALEELEKRYKRANVSNINILPWKGNELPVDELSCDGVLVDAPCSCSGTWRRNPDMRWTDDVTSVKQMPKLQLDILSKCAAAVKLEGYLVYATCSLTDLENSQVVNQFLANHDEFELQVLAHPFTGKQHSMLTIWPYEANTDGMFVVKMKKIK